MRHRQRSSGLLLFVLPVLAACAGDGHRLDGPDYGADGDPYVDPRLVRLPADQSWLTPGPEMRHRLILIGDAGDPRDNEATLATLARWGDARPESTTVVFLGDNLYPKGLQEDDRERGERILRSQLDATSARRVFTPGNHDWGYPVPSQENLAREQHFVESHPRGPVDFLPRGECPGPATTPLTAGQPGRPVTLILVDLQWWLIPEEQRPDCAGMTETRSVEQLRSELSARRGEWVVVAAHHPLRTGGPHGGLSYGALAEPIVALVRWRYGSLQNTYEPSYAHAVEQLGSALTQAPPLAYAAGHDHNLQLIQGDRLANFHIVSGAGAVRKISRVTNVEGTLFAHAHPGFVVLDFLREPNGEEAVLLHVIETGRPEPLLTTPLSTPPSPSD